MRDGGRCAALSPRGASTGRARGLRPRLGFAMVGDLPRCDGSTRTCATRLPSRSSLFACIIATRQGAREFQIHLGAILPCNLHVVNPSGVLKNYSPLLYERLCDGAVRFAARVGHSTRRSGTLPFNSPTS